jgi:glycosyltransferase involved in cell wall biosynthesis
MAAPIRLTIVIPVYQEGATILETLRRLERAVQHQHLVFVVYDFAEDNTLPALVRAEAELGLAVRRLRNRHGRGALAAVRTGLEAAETEYVVVTMADLSDPPEVINAMLEKADATGADVVCASRYMPGGGQRGGPWLKSLLSRLAGRTLHALAHCPTRDATNSFKLYRRSFLEAVVIESTGGFELGLELVVKAWKSGRRVAEVPTSWSGRTAGKSKFKLLRWLPKYLKWYLRAFRKA